MTEVTVKNQGKTSPYVAEKTETGAYVWHYCKFCGVAMNQDHKHKDDCPWLIKGEWD